MVDCDIYNVSTEAFKGLETYLHTLDVSNNNITEFPVRKLQQSFSSLLKLGLRDNKIKNLFPIYVNDMPEKLSKSNEKKKINIKSVDSDENKKYPREYDGHRDFYSLQDFDFSGWKNGPLQINILNGYLKITSN